MLQYPRISTVGILQVTIFVVYVTKILGPFYMTVFIYIQVKISLNFDYSLITSISTTACLTCRNGVNFCKHSHTVNLLLMDWAAYGQWITD